MTKGKGGTCLGCGGRLKEKHRRCRSCGKRNPFHQKAGRVATWKPGKGVRKAQEAAWLAKTAGRPVRGKAAAIRAWIEADLNSADPARREAARAALARLR